LPTGAGGHGVAPGPDRAGDAPEPAEGRHPPLDGVGWSSFMSPDPVPSRTTSLSRARISKRLFPVGRATTRWKLLVPMSIAATGVAASGAGDTTAAEVSLANRRAITVA